MILKGSFLRKRLVLQIKSLRNLYRKKNNSGFLYNLSMRNIYNRRGKRVKRVLYLMFRKVIVGSRMRLQRINYINTYLFNRWCIFFGNGRYGHQFKYYIRGKYKRLYSIAQSRLKINRENRNLKFRAVRRIIRSEFSEFSEQALVEHNRSFRKVRKQLRVPLVDYSFYLRFLDKLKHKRISRYLPRFSNIKLFGRTIFRVNYKELFLKNFFYNVLGYMDRFYLIGLWKKVGIQKYIANYRDNYSFFATVVRRFSSFWGYSLIDSNSVFSKYYLNSRNNFGKRVIRFPVHNSFVDFYVMSQFVVSFLFDYNGSLLTDVKFATHFHYNNYLVQRLFAVFSKFFSYYQFFFVSAPLVDNLGVYSLSSVNIGDNSFFKYQMYKYRKCVFYSNKNKMIVTLSDDNKLHFSFKHFNFVFADVDDINHYFYYKFVKRLFLREFYSLQSNSALDFEQKYDQILKLKDLFVSSLYKYKENFIFFYDNYLTGYLKKSLEANDSFFSHNVAKPTDVSYMSINLKPHRKNYFLEYCLFNFSQHYFFVTNFHLGVELNRWDPNFIYYYLGIRRNFLIMNMHKTMHGIQTMAYNIFDFIKYRLPVLVVNQNRLIDRFLYKAMHSLCLEQRVVMSGHRWLGGALSNLKRVWYLPTGLDKSYYKRAINYASTKYMRVAESLIPIGISLNNIKNNWFINELRGLHLQSHSIVDGNGVLVASENIIPGNTLSLSSNVFFLYICRMIVESALYSECAYFNYGEIADILVDDYAAGIGDFLYNKFVIKKPKRHAVRTVRSYKRVFLLDFVKRAPKVFRRLGLSKRRYTHLKPLLIKSKSKVLGNSIRRFRKIFKVNSFMYENLTDSPMEIVTKARYFKGKGTFFRFWHAAKASEQRRLSFLISSGYSAYLPRDDYEKNLLSKVFSLEYNNSYGFLYDFIEFLLIYYVKKIKKYRSKVLIKKNNWEC